jgi:2-keto-4-pentenoate hydratase/2-oxohepta-3-ene-1,7-dioic acid hydratase in catechol pathway
VVDLNRALAIKLAYDDAGAPEAEADSLVPSDIISDAPDVLRAGAVVPQSGLQLHAPVARPGKIIGVSGTFPDPKNDTTAGRRVPGLFLKAPSAVIGPDEEIVLPSWDASFDFGGELAVVIGAPIRNATTEEAIESIAGYCVATDLTARSRESSQSHNSPSPDSSPSPESPPSPDWGSDSIRKSCDTFSPLGPALVTPDELSNPDELAIRSSVSGEVTHVSSMKELRFPVASIVTFAASIMTLEPGDVILTGTPGAPAIAGERRCLRDGDLIEVEIDSLGRLRNYVTSDSRGKARSS